VVNLDAYIFGYRIAAKELDTTASVGKNPISELNELAQKIGSIACWEFTQTSAASQPTV